MKVLLLAAGRGTRLRPLTDTVPKCLVPIQGRPLLDYWLDHLSAAGIGPALVNLHHHADKVKEFLRKSSYGEGVATVYEKELLGTGGTLMKNRDFFGREALMLVHADNLCLCDFRSFVDSHSRRPQNTEITMMTFITDFPERCGIVEIDAAGTVRAFHEKVENPPGNLANGAVYVLENSVIEFMESLGKSYVDFSLDVLPHYLNRIHTWHNEGCHIDIGTAGDLQKAQKICAELGI